MIILGISDSHEAHACIVKDGRLLAAIAEERISRLKADVGYPRRSIEAVLRVSGVKPDQIDAVALASKRTLAFGQLYKQHALFSVQEWIRQVREYWGPVLIDGKSLTPWDDFEQSKHVQNPVALKEDAYYAVLERVKDKATNEHFAIFNQLRREVISSHLGIDPSKIRFYRHEDCHKAYGYYSSPFQGEKALVFTIEGGGDDSSATISIATDNEIVELWKSNSVQVGRLYRYVTLLLGMKPGQHEYKVMGLAPYGTQYHGQRSLDFFRTINKVQGTQIVDTKTVPDLYLSVRDTLEGERFDGIAWGLQTWTEEILVDWITNNCRSLGIDRVIISGGVAQNIKACQKLLELPDITQFWVGPIAGDGSLALGGAWLASRELEPQVPVLGLTTIYLGTSYTKEQIDEAIERHALGSRFHIVDNASASQVAEWLSHGCVIARFSGRMEFGQRALGNRSILADPRRSKSVEKINNKIKYRDFWMPFTPTMLYEDVDRFLVDPKKMYSPYMMMAFDLKPEYEDVIPAVIHPADKTVRPQMLRRNDNPGYYEIISAFKERTGLGVVLNTSFNLHGDAIVESPDDAINTFLKSDLDILLFDHRAILRIDPSLPNDAGLGSEKELDHVLVAGKI